RRGGGGPGARRARRAPGARGGGPRGVEGALSRGRVASRAAHAARGDASWSFVRVAGCTALAGRDGYREPSSADHRKAAGAGRRGERASAGGAGRNGHTTS